MRNRKVTIGIVISLVLAVISLGVAFAAFSTTLNINGSATVESSNWNVFLTTSRTGSDPGSNGVSLPNNGIEIEGTANSVSTTLTSDTFTWSGTVKSPGDSIEYEFYVRNEGDYDAAISVSGGTFLETDWLYGADWYNVTVSCTQNNVVTQEATTVCSHIKYKIGVTQSDELLYHNNWTTVHVIITLDETGWAEDGSDLPKNPVTVIATPITITATQAGSAH